MFELVLNIKLLVAALPVPFRGDNLAKLVFCRSFGLRFLRRKHIESIKLTLAKFVLFC